MDSQAFRVVRREEGSLPILAPEGRITLGQSARDLRQAFDQLAGEGHRWLLVNMSDVPYVDSAGLGTLVTGMNLFRKGGGAMALCCVQPRVSQLLELTNLTGVIRVASTEPAGVQTLSEAMNPSPNPLK